jgi:hypothetical protein
MQRRFRTIICMVNRSTEFIHRPQLFIVDIPIEGLVDRVGQVRTVEWRTHIKELNAEHRLSLRERDLALI